MTTSTLPSSGWDFAMLPPETTPLIVLAEGCFGEPASKLALGVIRYGQWPITAVIDSNLAGKTVRQTTGIPNDAPIVASLEAALALTSQIKGKSVAPQALLLGTAPPGGQLPPEWRPLLMQAIAHGLHLINGLHFFLEEEPSLVTLAQKHGVRLWDVRNPDGYGQNRDGEARFRRITHRRPRPQNVHVITMVGTDCSVGKMHVALELTACARRHGASAGFIATGQTGILIAGNGVPLDRVIGDFMAGAVEECIDAEIERLEAECPDAEHWLFVEGQGSLLHPAYSGVTLSLLHGSNADALILCHKAGLSAIRHFPQITLPPLKAIAASYETASSWSRANQQASPVLGVCVNSSPIAEEDKARTLLQQIESETSLPTTDPVRYGVEALWKHLRQHRQAHTGTSQPSVSGSAV
jgi:uncharacterized NAD-dependent epimerase/dehydratase family protein